MSKETISTGRETTGRLMTRRRFLAGTGAVALAGVITMIDGNRRIVEGNAEVNSVYGESVFTHRSYGIAVRELANGTGQQSDIGNESAKADLQALKAAAINVSQREEQRSEALSNNTGRKIGRLELGSGAVISGLSSVFIMFEAIKSWFGEIEGK